MTPYDPNIETFGPLTTKGDARRAARDYRRKVGWDAANKPPRKAKKQPKPWKGNVVYGVRRTSRHPLRAVESFFHELSDRGMMAALDLKFGRPRTHGSAESLRARPRGLPGTGMASWLSRPELLRRIERLRIYIGVKQYVG